LWGSRKTKKINQRSTGVQEKKNINKFWGSRKAKKNIIISSGA
jgi:hypothetical protein